MDINPYAPLQAPVDGSTPPEPDPATIERRAHIKVERRLRLFGSRMVLLGGWMLVLWMGCLLATVSELAGALGWSPPPKSVLGLDRLLPVLLGLGCTGAGLIVLGRRLRELRPSVRIPTTVLAVALLILFPAGTIVGGQLLARLRSPEGRRVFAPDYARLVAATPHVADEHKQALSRRVPWLYVVALILLLCVLGYSRL